jgi:hypothetical protein
MLTPSLERFLIGQAESNRWNLHPLGGYAAAKSTSSKFSFSKNRSSLNVSGIVIGCVNTYGLRVEPATSTHSILMTFHHSRLQLIRYFGYEVSKHEAFCRTLSAGAVRGLSPRRRFSLTYYTMTCYTQKSFPAMPVDPKLVLFEEETPNPSDETTRLAVFENYLHSFKGRRFLITDDGMLCLGSGCASGGDLICVLLGCSTPVILRECEGYYAYVGDVYADGYMHGTAIEELNDGTRQLQTFELRQIFSITLVSTEINACIPRLKTSRKSTSSMEVGSIFEDFAECFGFNNENLHFRGPSLFTYANLLS